MWFTRQADGYRAWFVLSDSKGALITGAVGGDFTVTVVDPADTATSTPTVSESAQKSGLYTFLVPSAFITTNGIGSYGVVIEVAKTSNPKVDDVLSSALRVNVRDFDTTLEAIVDGSLTGLDALKYLLSMAAGAFAETTISPTITDFAFTDRAGDPLYTLRYTEDTSRARTAG